MRELRKVAPEGRDMTDAPRAFVLSFTDERCSCLELEIGKAFEFRRGDKADEGVSFYTMNVPC